MDKKLLENILIHDKVAKRYEAIHGEIYNEVEQRRLSDALAKAVSEISTDSQEKVALDFGCGAGNLTQYLLGLNLTVIAADISVNFLKLVEYKYKTESARLSFLQLNGTDLANIEDSSLDFVCLYSVLHHIPDYLGIIKEFSRVLKPGGVLYIDHEASPQVWNQNEKYKEYAKKMNSINAQKNRWNRVRHLFIPEYWVNAVKEFLDPRYKPEGDIHVFADDHIEWDKVGAVFTETGLEVVQSDDYLLFTKHCPQELYNQFKNTCNDIRLVVARKK